jgi:hypothetical protein
LDICELLPRHAAVAEKFTILRSMVHTGFCHQQGLQQMFTGHPVRELRNKPDDPDLMAIANYLRWDPARRIPNSVGMPPLPYGGAAYLGPKYEPFVVSGDPNSPEFSVPNIGLTDEQLKQRLQQRLGLRAELDRLRCDLDQFGNMQALDAFEQQAWSMLTSPEARQAFDINQEHAATRDRYGRSRWGQQVLMARRLVEAGVDLVTVSLLGAEAGPVGNWDDHAVNHHVFDVMKKRAPIFDRAVTALIEDLHERSLDKRVMVVVTGEFGRTPKISYATGTISKVNQPGRDHWPSATSILFAGGGLSTGQVIGATDSRGEYVTQRRVGVTDFLATLYRHLDIAPEGIAFTNFSGRPVPIPAAAPPIPELVAGG